MSAELGHRSVDRQQCASGDCAQSHDHFRLDSVDLAHEKGRAGLAFVALRRTVGGRPTLDDVGNINVFAAKAHGLDHVGQELAGAPHERFALFVFISAGSFANEHEISVGITDAKDDLFAPLFVKAAAGAVTDVFANKLEWGGGGVFYRNDL